MFKEKKKEKDKERKGKKELMDEQMLKHSSEKEKKSIGK